MILYILKQHKCVCVTKIYNYKTNTYLKGVSYL